MFRRNKPNEPEQTLSTPTGALSAGVSSSGSPTDTTLEKSPRDTGVGIPPFRPAPPAPPKDINMARPPFSNPAANPPMPPSAPPRPPGPPVTRPSFGRDAAAERRTLVVGRGISVQGMVQDAERLVVEGTVEATLINAAELSVSHGGVFKGEIEVEEAEVAGTVDGTIVARSALIVRATGVVLGTARCRRLQVEDGGQITGRIEMIADAAPRPPTPAASSSSGTASAPSPLQTVHSFES